MDTFSEYKHCEDCDTLHLQSMHYCLYHNKCYDYIHKECNKCGMCIALNNKHDQYTNERICNLCDTLSQLKNIKLNKDTKNKASNQTIEDLITVNYII
jgi:hypothetical protein